MNKRKTPNRKPISPGTQFNKWTVIRKGGKDRNGQTLYVCRCECGNIKAIRKTELLSGHSKSCGCIVKEMLIERNTGKVSPKRLDLTGKRFGNLVALEFAYTKNKRTFWKCKCDCGNIAEVDRGFLRSGATTSCGCVGSKNINKCMVAQRQNELREQTNLSQLSNVPFKSNTTGRRGITFNKKKQVFVARITFQGKRFYLGSFKDFDKAVIAREEAEEKLFNPILEKYGREQIINPREISKERK